MCPKGFLSASELLFFSCFPLITGWVEKKQERNGKLVKEIQKKGVRVIFNERDWGSIIERQREIEMQMCLFFAEGEGNISSSYSWGHVMITLRMKIFTNSVEGGKGPQHRITLDIRWQKVSANNVAQTTRETWSHQSPEALRPHVVSLIILSFKGLSRRQHKALHVSLICTEPHLRGGLSFNI